MTFLRKAINLFLFSKTKNKCEMIPKTMLTENHYEYIVNIWHISQLYQPFTYRSVCTALSKQWTKHYKQFSTFIVPCASLCSTARVCFFLVDLWVNKAAKPWINAALCLLMMWSRVYPPSSTSLPRTPWFPEAKKRLRVTKNPFTTSRASTKPFMSMCEGKGKVIIFLNGCTFCTCVMCDQ